MDQTSLFDLEDDLSSQIVGVVADGQGVIYRQLQTESYQNYIQFNAITMAVLQYNNAWMTHAPKDWENAFVSINDALSTHHENALMLALLSNVYYADALHELNLAPNSRARMEPLAQKAVSLDPHLQIARYNLVLQNAFFGRVEECVAEAREVLSLNRSHARVMAGCAFAVTTVGDYDFGLKLIERAKQLNPHYPSWYHFVNYLVHFKNGAFEKAWIEAQRIEVKGLVWHSLLRASVLGKLGRIKEGSAFLDDLVQMKPEFPKRPHEYIRALVVLDKHVEMICDGLYKAGLKNL